MKTLKRLLKGSNIVGVIASPADLRIALRDPRVADIYEWRFDRFAGTVAERGIIKLRDLGCPIILTIRSPDEGGTNQGWNNVDRAEWYQRYLHLATFIDIEASSVRDNGPLMAVTSRAKQIGVGIIISKHILTQPWDMNSAVDACRVCGNLGGHICKIALRSGSFDEVCSFIGCLPDLSSRMNDLKIAPMIIGVAFGKVSRILFALSKAPLVYGYLGKACVKGQWHVSQIRPMMRKMR